MKVLVTAASKHGSTAEIAAAIAEQLRLAGLHVEEADPAHVMSLADVDAVVLGSAVYAGHWMAEAKELVERLGAGLRERRVWLFSSGPVGDPPKPDEDPVDVVEVMEQTGAVAHLVLAGKIDKALLGFGERALVAALRAPVGDFRDWVAIRGFADDVADALLAVDADR